MAKKYFTALCVMNSADLRANVLHHSSLIFFEADCNEFGQIQRPLRPVDAYGFYSHPIPDRPSIFTPVTLFAYAAGIPRISGSYGEWRRENIHDLALGRGLTGLLFKMSFVQFRCIQEEIKAKIITQERFFTNKVSIQEKEAFYQNAVEEMATALTENGVEPDDANTQARTLLPIPAFSPGYNCKVAALEMIESSYHRLPKKIHDLIKALKGEGISSLIPRLTDGLKEIIIHAETDKWEVRGNTSKYPYYDWNQAYTDDAFSMYAVDFGGQYINTDGNPRFLDSLSNTDRETVKELKIISRICEIQLHDTDFKLWNHEISKHIRHISIATNKKDRASYTETANDYLTQLLHDPLFNEKTQSKLLPSYLNIQLEFLHELHPVINNRMAM